MAGAEFYMIADNYEEEHYLYQLRETFTLDELDIAYFDMYVSEYTSPCFTFHP